MSRNKMRVRTDSIVETVPVAFTVMRFDWGKKT